MRPLLLLLALASLAAASPALVPQWPALLEPATPETFQTELYALRSARLPATARTASRFGGLAAGVCDLPRVHHAFTAAGAASRGLQVRWDG